MLSLTAFADELEREQARQRTYDAMRRKALAGQGRRSHVERHISDDEAAVVRNIFERCAQGWCLACGTEVY